jgi:hypothetical protein
VGNLAELIKPESVRRAIDASLKASDLPDEVIHDELYVNLAITEVLQRDPDAAGYEGDKQKRVGLALNLFLAATVARFVPFITKEDFGDGGGYSRQQVDVDKLIANLQRMGSEQMALLGPDKATVKSRMPTFFALGHGTRGKY